MITAMKLTKLGYGKIEEILNMPVNVVFDIIHYENFISEYEKNFIFLNTKKEE